MKAMKKIVSLILVLMVVVSAMAPAALASTSPESSSTIAETSQLVITPRLREEVVVTSYTEIWQFLPYSVISNNIVCFVSSGTRLNFLGLSSDVYGNLWYKVSIISLPGYPTLTGAVGYISASASKTVVG